jgi:hypothetical protein
MKGDFVTQNVEICGLGIMNEIELPFPPAILSPNARPHWSVKAKAVKAARAWATQTCMIDKFKAPETDGKLHLWIEYYCKTKRRMDADNALSMTKAYIDGIADYLGIKDRMFVLHPMVMDETGGYIKIRITSGI